MRKSELNLSLLKNSLETLKECYSDLSAQTDEKLKTYIKDSCIQRFEYTYECAKKIMNKFLKKEYDKQDSELSINNIFREMNGLGFIQNFDNWVEYRQKRNLKSHEYNIELTYPIIDIIPKFINDTEFLIHKLETVLKDN